MDLTLAQAQAIVYVLTKKAKHRATQPFSNELLGYLKGSTNDKQSYHFLSEDYYQCKLVPTGNPRFPFRLITDSDKADIVNRTLETNQELAEVFNVGARA